MSIRTTRTLTIAAALVMLPISLLAQTPNASAASSGAVPANAILLSTIDANKTQPGADFKAKLARKVVLPNGPELPSGTILAGTITTDDMNEPGNGKLALRFTEAQLKNGQMVPIKAVIMAANMAEVPGQEVRFEPESLDGWNDGTLAANQVNVFSGVDLYSKVTSSNSGVFVTTKNDVKLGQGTDLSLAIAEGQANSAALASD